MDFYKVNVRMGELPLHGYPIQATRRSFFDPIAALIRRTLSALQTPQAYASLRSISLQWRCQWGADYDVEDSVIVFQGLLQRAADNPEFLPIIVVDYRMRCDVDGAFVIPRYFTERTGPHVFPLGEQVIKLNGQRVHLYLKDYHDNNPELYPRCWELLVTCLHEFTHMFIVYLSIRYEGDSSCSTPTTCIVEHRSLRPESGFTFEQSFFGGCLVRGIDSSRREPRFMPGAPVFQVIGTDRWGIPLEKMINILDKPLGQPYSASDFELDLYPPKSLDNSTPLSVQFPRWWREFKQRFGVDFARDISQDDHHDYDEVSDKYNLPINEWAWNKGADEEAPNTPSSTAEDPIGNIEVESALTNQILPHLHIDVGGDSVVEVISSEEETGHEEST
ncbi:hypothetical protein FQN54_008019 [Arachnomyces sp. PD_36]|nr:hypothetical protein FQN54_008019 [Arachnomyces sp. PD_36]